MAVQIDPPGQLQEFLAILKRRVWQIVLPTLFSLSLGVGFAIIVPKKYEVTTQVELRETLAGVGGASGTELSLSAREAENAPHQIKSLQRIRWVVEKLNWAEYLTLPREEQYEYLQDIQDSLTVTVPRKNKDVGSTFVTIEYLDTSAQRAEEFLRELRTAWIEQVVERDRDKIKLEYSNLLAQQAAKEKVLQREHRQLTELRGRYGLSPTQPTPGSNQGRTEDPAYLRLMELETRIDELALEEAAAQATVEELAGQLEQTDERVQEMAYVEGQTYDEKLEELRAERAQHLSELRTGGWRPAHSTYRQLQHLIETVEGNIDALEKLVTRGEVQENWVPNEAWQILNERLAGAELALVLVGKERVELEKKFEQDQEVLRQLQDVYREDSEHSEAITRLTTSLADVDVMLQRKKHQMEFIETSSGNPFQIMQDVVAPSTPSEPNPFMIVAFALVAGLALGAGSAILAELSRSSFKSAADISAVMLIPVLGVVEDIVTRAQLRRRLLRRIAVGSSSTVLIGAVVFVTWAWATNPDLLAPDVLDGIEEFRELFR
ncbi:MAG: hypothetical protein CMJ84_08915 [Planctomycetes bacterium]|jgi:uncharacterized protein involved in exopolysaccharide biosynthesis|nr:hypothetical protein [Planctomycetota bacterium]MDP6408954.1 hypothetical protein [Planctomycetota bacterium]